MRKYDDDGYIYYVVKTAGYYAVFENVFSPEYAYECMTEEDIRDMVFEIARCDMAYIPMPDDELKAEIERADIGGLIDYIESVDE